MLEGALCGLLSEQGRGPGMAAVNVLHVSDLHMRAQDLSDIQIVVCALLHDVELWTRDYATRPDIVCFTGDLALNGKAEEYELARRHFLDPLLPVRGCRAIACSGYLAITTSTAAASEARSSGGLWRRS